MGKGSKSGVGGRRGLLLPCPFWGAAGTGWLPQAGPEGLPQRELWAGLGVNAEQQRYRGSVIYGAAAGLP